MPYAVASASLAADSGAVAAAGGALAAREPLSGAARRPRRELDDPVAEDAVGDPQVALERLDQRSIAVELEEVVLGLIAMLDRVGQRPHAPALFEQELAARLDLGARV
jgi:hypothetical protein